jgi:hypothetical protein
MEMKYWTKSDYIIKDFSWSQFHEQTQYSCTPIQSVSENTPRRELVFNPGSDVKILYESRQKWGQEGWRPKDRPRKKKTLDILSSNRYWRHKSVQDWHMWNK